jgi:gamma-glutamylcyclotransferase (GGCT)/AIG2-like uncharacterized protein YtfP
MSDYLFVCGTLRPAIIRDELRWFVEQTTFVGRGAVRGRLYDLGEYPGAVLDASGDSLIIGDLVELPANPQVLAALDEYEGYSETNPDAGLFVRCRCQVRLDDGREIESWMYVYNGDVSTVAIIAKGDYLDVRNHNEEKNG